MGRYCRPTTSSTSFRPSRGDDRAGPVPRGRAPERTGSTWWMSWTVWSATSRHVPSWNCSVPGRASSTARTDVTGSGQGLPSPRRHVGPGCGTKHYDTCVENRDLGRGPRRTPGPDRRPRGTRRGWVGHCLAVSRLGRPRCPRPPRRFGQDHPMGFPARDGGGAIRLRPGQRRWDQSGQGTTSGGHAGRLQGSMYRHHHAAGCLGYQTGGSFCPRRGHSASPRDRSIIPTGPCCPCARPSAENEREDRRWQGDGAGVSPDRLRYTLRSRERTRGARIRHRSSPRGVGQTDRDRRDRRSRSPRSPRDGRHLTGPAEDSPAENPGRRALAASA